MTELREMLNSWGTVRTYATREALLKGLEKQGLTSLLSAAVIVRVPTEEARWTAIFLKSFVEETGHNIMYPVYKGFKVMG